MKDLSDIKQIAVLGTGLMGHGIAQYFALHDYRVNIYDKDKRMLESVPEKVRRNFDVFLKLELCTLDDVEKTISNITLRSNLREVCDEVQYIVEAISEDLSIKQTVFKEIEGYVKEDTILTTNTSAISITAISECLKKKDRFLGTHFWNPPHVLPCVEVIKGDHTSEDAFNFVFQFMKHVKKEPVKVLQDVPGFIGNRLQHAMWREAISMVDKNIASAEDIDKVVKNAFGLRLSFIGPLETADLAGLDLNLDINRYLFPYLESSPEPSPIQIEKVRKGELGVKTGRGFHEWPEDKKTRIIDNRDYILLKIMNEIKPTYES